MPRFTHYTDTIPLFQSRASLIVIEAYLVS